MLSPRTAVIAVCIIVLALLVSVTATPAATDGRRNRNRPQQYKSQPNPKHHGHHNSHSADTAGPNADTLIPVALPVHASEPLVKVDVLRREPTETTGDLIRPNPAPIGILNSPLEPRHNVDANAHGNGKVNAGDRGSRYRLAATKQRNGWSSSNKNGNGGNGKQQWHGQSQSQSNNNHDQQYDQYDNTANNYAVAQSQEQSQSSVVYYEAVPIAASSSSHGLINLDLNLKRGVDEELVRFTPILLTRHPPLTSRLLSLQFANDVRAGLAAHAIKQVPVATGHAPSDADVNAAAALATGNEFLFEPVRQGAVKIPFHVFGTNKHSTASATSTESVSTAESTTSASASSTASVITQAKAGSLIDLDLDIGVLGLKRDEPPVPTGTAEDFLLVPGNGVQLPPVDAANAISDDDDCEDEPTTDSASSTLAPESSPATTTTVGIAAHLPMHAVATPSPSVAAPTPTHGALNIATERRPTVLEPQAQALVQAAVVKELLGKNKLMPWVAPANFGTAPGVAVQSLPQGMVEAL